MMKNMSLVKNVQLVGITSDSSLNAYIRQVNSIPILTLEEENELTERFWKDIDFAAAQKLILSHLRLVVKIARSFSSYDLPIQDMISEGNIGLMKAVKKFTPNIGCRLATYASWWIRAAIQEYILNSFSLLKISTKDMKRKLFYKLAETKESIKRLTDGSGNSLMSTQCISLDSQGNDNARSLLDLMPTTDKCHAEALIEREEQSIQLALLKRGIDNLNDREKDILYRRRLKENPDKLGDIAKIYGLSQERVRQIEQKVIEKLKSFALKESYA